MTDAPRRSTVNEARREASRTTDHPTTEARPDLRTADDWLAEEYAYVDPKFAAAFRVGWAAHEREAAASAQDTLDVLTEARRDHQPTLYADAEHDGTVHCRCGRRDHMAGWFAHFTVEVLEARLRG